jgi:hypothetical protein
MKQQTKTITLLFINSIVLFALVSLSGCTTNQTKNQTTNEYANSLIGTWAGTLQIPMFGGENNTTVTQISFTMNRSEMILSGAEKTLTMNYTYIATSDTLTLTPLMTERNGFTGGEPFNGTAPPNGTMFPRNRTSPPNGTLPPGNGTLPPNGGNPYNGSWPSNGTRPQGDMRQSMTVTLSYTLDKEAGILLLNNARFTKIQ